MQKEKPSKTAEQMAASRFGESIKPENERLCYDPYAKEFLTSRLYSPLLKSSLARKIMVKIIESLFRDTIITL